MKVKLLSRVRLLATAWTVEPTRLLHPWDFPGKSGVPLPSPATCTAHAQLSEHAQCVRAHPLLRMRLGAHTPS